MINDEFGEIIDDGVKETGAMESEPTSNHSAREMTPDTASGPSHRDKTQIQGKSNARLTREEESSLADYLSIGMSIEDAREAFETKVKAAKLRMRVCENQRAWQCRSIQSASRTQWGPSTNNRGTGREGLSFN